MGKKISGYVAAKERNGATKGPFCGKLRDAPLTFAGKCVTLPAENLR